MTARGRLASGIVLLALLSIAPFVALAQQGGPTNSTPSCGGEGQPPCQPGGTCTSGSVPWNDGNCHPTQSGCGDTGQPICRSGATCHQDLDASSGTCRVSGGCQGSSCGGCNGPQCGGCSGPQCGGGGPNCPTCPPGCDGQQGGGGNSDPTKPNFRMDDGSGGRTGPAILVAGLLNDVTFVATNPLKVPFTGHIDLGAPRATFNVTHIDLTLAPGELRAIHARVAVPLDGRLDASTRMNGTIDGAIFCIQGGLGGAIAPPVSMEWRSPMPNDALATVQRLASQNGGGGPGGSDTQLAFGHATSIKVQATNFANATSTAFYLFARANGQMLGAGTLVAPLAPGASVTLDLGRIPPRPADCGGPVPKAGCSDTTYLDLSGSSRPDSPDGGAQVADFTVKDGVVTSTRSLTLAIQDPGTVLPLVEAARVAQLGKPYVATLNVTNHGTGAVSNQVVNLAFVPPFRAQYDVQGEESTSYTISTSPGQTATRTALFTPMISGRWEILVRYVPPGETCCATNSFTVDVPGDVNVSVPTSSTSIAVLGESARTPIRVRADAAISGATLRITTAPQASDREGGGGGSPNAPVVLGGLWATLVSADPASVPLGDLAAGADVWSNVTVTSRASGLYNVVPYVVAGGFAYTGRPLPANDGPVAARPDFAPQYLIAFEANHTPLPLAYGPVALVLVLAVGAFVGRRVWIK